MLSSPAELNQTDGIALENIKAERLENSNENDDLEVEKSESESGDDGNDNIPLIEGEAENDMAKILQQHEKEFQQQQQNRIELLMQQLLDRTKVPQSYYTNSKKEKWILQYLSNFNRQYSQLYPFRKDLFLCPINEFGIQKFICNSIRPTQISCDLYDYRACAKFIADFIEFKPLDPPHELPKILNSPTFTIKTQKGNSFDMSILLVSLLAGVGYNAFVVSGYADKCITTMDQSKKPSLELHDLVEQVQNEFQFFKLEDSNKNQTPLKYKTRKSKDLKSNFLSKQEEKIKAIQQMAEKRARDANIKAEVVEEDELHGLRVHSWVLVLPGRREVSEAFFIEPTTGEIFDCEYVNYLGVESVWGTHNYWVNMQICYDGLKGISFDLADIVKWEFVLLDNTQPIPRKKKSENENGSDDEEEEMKEVLDLPPTWVDKLQITREQFELKTPQGFKTVYYKNAKKEIFAEYNRNDGMVLRVTFLEKDDRYAGMVVEQFKNRKDKLIKRVINGNKIHEYFEPGRLRGLKESITIDGKTVEMLFYSSARPDGLYKRTEEPRKIIFYFENRDDFIIYRSVTYEMIKNPEDSEKVRGNIIKMAEKFDRNPNIPAHENSCKTTYFLKDDKIKIRFHLDEGRIIHSYREFKKPAPDQKGQLLDISQNFVVDRYLKPMKAHHLLAQLFELLKQEQIFIQSVKSFEREINDLLNRRKMEESELSLVISIYDTMRNVTELPVEDENTERIKADDESKKSLEIDYLSPYLINFDNPQSLTKEEQISAKEACLKALRDRLVEKATIIQTRLDEITSEYQKQQVAYSRNADSMTVEETDEYVRFCNESLFKIRILEKRLAKHKEMAPEKYIELDGKLRSDKRLILAYQ